MKRLTLAMALGLALGGSAQAVVLPVNTLTPLGGTTEAANPQLAGTVLEDDTVAFSFAAYGGTVSGSVQSRVVRSSVDGTLDFYWRVFNDPNSAGPITSFRIGNFVTPVYDANYRTDGLGDVGPDSAYHFNAPYVNFLFGDLGGSTLGPGASSDFMFLDTRATSYARTAVYDVTSTGPISDSFSTFAPMPEPGTFALLAGGMGLLALGRRRRG
jgi:hypothetical protein